MKKVYVLLFVFTYLLSNEILLENCQKKILLLNTIPKKYYVIIHKKAILDKKPHYYTGITLKTLQKIIGGKTNKLTFIAYDDYKVKFNKKEINSPNILFVFLEDNKSIPLYQKGPARIIYIKNDTKKNYFFKSIFLIKKVICEK